MKQQVTFGILGYGYVGRATHHGILNHAKISIHDTLLGTSRDNLKDSMYIFVCIPTSNQTEINLLKNEVLALSSQNPSSQIIIRSTVPIGTCKEIERLIEKKIYYIPEFLRERYWDTDSLKRPLIVGHNGLELPEWLSQENIFECSTAEAEVLKMFSNNFAVVRIAFANLFYDIAQTEGADYNKIKNMFFKIMHDQTYMEVPGHDGTRGFGGKCLPKDLDFLIETLEEKKLDSTWYKNIRNLNKEWQKKF